jgi:hypothetical protein
MWGYEMTTVNNIQGVVETIKESSYTYKEGGKWLFRSCVFGIFNPRLAAQLLKPLPIQTTSKRVNGGP